MNSIFFDTNFVGPKIIFDTNFCSVYYFWTHNVFGPNFLVLFLGFYINLVKPLFLTQIFMEMSFFFDPTLFFTQNIFGPKMHLIGVCHWRWLNLFSLKTSGGQGGSHQYIFPAIFEGGRVGKKLGKLVKEKNTNSAVPFQIGTLRPVYLLILLIFDPLMI